MVSFEIGSNSGLWCTIVFVGCVRQLSASGKHPGYFTDLVSYVLGDLFN